MNRFIQALTGLIIILTILTTVTPLNAQQNYIRCSTMEADSMMRAKIPNAPTLQDFEIWLQDKMSQSNFSGGPQIYTIPVVFHVVHNGDGVGQNENLSAAQIYSQIDVLNEDFRRLNADTVNTPAAYQGVAADAQIEFCAAVVDPNGNLLAEPGINRVNGGQASWSSTNDIDNNLKPATIWDPERYFNIWTVDFGSGGLLGYAQFPEGSGLAGMPGGAQPANTDGIVLRATATGRVGNLGSGFDLGRTCTHEVGHWLGLRHIWGDGGCGVDDFCADTPESDASNYGCQTNTSSCGSQDMVENYMDYSDDACMNLFTEDQKARMLTVLFNSPRRVELLNSTVCQVPVQYTVTGQVRDATNQQGVANAKVRAIDGNINYTTTCDANGNFTLTMTPGTYQFIGGEWGYINNGVSGVSIQDDTSGIIIDIEPGYYDDFALEFNWNENSSSTTGQWERDAPIGTDFNGTPSNPGADVTTDYAFECYVTGNAGGAAGNDDVDDGVTSFTSPVMDLTTYNDPVVKYFRWFYNDGGSGALDDTLKVFMSNGAATVLLEEVTDNQGVNNEWNYREFRVQDYLSITNNMTITYETSDLNASGHIVEGGVDLFRVTDTVVNTNLPPTADFGGSPTNVCPGESVAFFDASGNQPTSWQWDFPGGTPSTSTLQNPVVTYNNPGTYDVTLTVTNANGSDNITQTGFVTVAAGQSITVFSDDFESGSFNTQGWNVVNGDNDVTWEIFSVAGTTPGNQAARVNLFAYQNGVGERDYLETPVLDLAAVQNTQLDFEHAHRRYSQNQADSLLVQVSTDGGNSWPFTELAVAEDGTGTFATNTTQQADFVPAAADDWCFSGGLGASCFSIDMSAYDGEPNVKVRFASVNDYGNNIYVDNVAVTGECTVPTNAPDADFTANVTSGCAPLTVTFTDQSTNNPTSWNWNFPGGTPGTSVQQNPTVTYNTPGTYAVTLNVSNSGGSDAENKGGYITVYGSPNAIGSSNDVSCNGGSDGFATVTASGTTPPYTYEWNTGATTQSLNGIGTGTYTVTVTDGNGCTTQTTVTVDEPLELLATTTSTPAFCGNSNGSAEVAVSGGTQPYSYSWSNGGSGVAINNLSPGSYSVTVTDDNGCDEVATVNVADNTPTININFSINNVTCFGGSDGNVTATPSGGTAPYTYDWSNGNNTNSITGISSGNYTVTVTDDNGCTASSSVFVGEPDEILLNATVEDAVCGSTNGYIALAVSGGASPYSYNWGNGATTDSIGGLGAGSYTVVVTDDDGCTKQATFNISNQGGPSILTSGTDPDCPGSADGSASVTVNNATPPVTISWSTGDSGNNITGLSAGTYSVTVSDGNGCSTIGDVILTDPDAIVITPQVTDANCGNTDGSVQLTVTGGAAPYGYQWSNGGNSSSITAVAAGTYTVTVTDDNGCTATASATVGSNNGPTILVTTTNVSCSGAADGNASATVNGGTGPYTIDWSSGGSGNIVSGLSTGNYVVTVTDANGCIDTTGFSISSPPAINVTVNVDDANCGNADGSVSVSVSGGVAPYTYLWSTGQVSSSINNVSAGNYDLTVTDANNCFETLTTTVNNVGGPTLALSTQNISCFGAADGSVVTSLAGGTPPFTFNWSNGASTQNLQGIGPGTYDLTVTDAAGCESLGSATVSQPIELEAQLTVTNIGCNGAPGAITANSVGGVGPYVYEWSNGSSNSTIAGLTAVGTYTVTVTDDNGCTAASSALLGEEDGLSISMSSTPDSTLSGIGTATANPNNGSAPFSYQWNDANSQTTSTATGLTQGWYTVTVTDADSCTAVDSVEVEGGTIGVDELSNDWSVEVYPNPTNGRFNIVFSGNYSNETAITIFDPLGRKVSGVKYPQGTSTVEMDISNFAEGLYLVRIETADRVLTKRIILSAAR